MLKTSKRTEVGETIAMALAELGDFQMAAAIQRGVLQAAQQAGLQAQGRPHDGQSTSVRTSSTVPPVVAG